MAVYCLDWGDSGRTENVDLLNPSTGLSELTNGPVALSNFQNGTWVIFYFTGNVELKVTNTGSVNAVISVIAFDNQCMVPTFSPAAGTYTSAQAVTISTASSGATMRYTTDGSTPSETHGTMYSSPVIISSDTTLQAIAYETGMDDSAVASGVYTMNLSATYTLDTTTQGSWWSSSGGYVYGSDGYDLCAWNGGTDVVNLPTGSYVQSVTPSNQYNTLWAANQANPAPINPQTGTRNAACWYDFNYSWFDAQVTLVNPNDGIRHRMAVYCLDWGDSGRTENLDLLNPATGLSILTMARWRCQFPERDLGDLLLHRQCRAEGYQHRFNQRGHLGNCL